MLILYYEYRAKRVQAANRGLFCCEEGGGSRT
nr:MAG TPA_asm: hypothetical protein [Caudoviricetes sp.]